jgi:photolyase PhrII
MRTAVRVNENPALDVAKCLARQYRLPLLVYQGLSEHYEFASDRHHTFILEGARDVQRQFEELGISYAFHLATPEDRREHLVALAGQAAFLVTEDMPTDPARRFLLALIRKSAVPVICVDTACVLPMQLVTAAPERAYQYRDSTRMMYESRITRPWAEMPGPLSRFDPGRLPFQPLDLQIESIPGLVARCQIDHSVGPVVDARGGTTSGYERWDSFRRNGLARYDQMRNDALADGVSRLSPYLHYGMVSPFRIARETASSAGSGSQKYLDELLIWREMAYCFCFHRPEHDQWEAVPEWARQSLEAHAADRRPAVYSWEALARGETDDPLWNAAQKSLLRHGELHNNLRMTWGKALLHWTNSPQKALQLMIDLNHRYALDGRDPASCGGILWCLGQFDRAFEPEQPITGKVRQRPTSVHSARLNVQQYSDKVVTSRCRPVPRVAVIGAGISGLFAARTLADHGLHVTVFEKSRGVGGRMATRRTGNALSFDHGAQYFTARNKRFRQYVDSWIEQGLVAEWPNMRAGADQRLVVLGQGRIASESSSQQRFVGVPAMNSICKHLSDNLEIHKKVRINAIRRVDSSLTLVDDQARAHAGFDRLVVSAPAQQSAELLADFPELREEISGISMNPCWATMAAFAEHVTDQWVGAFIHDSFLVWAARNSSKPGRGRALDQWVFHADAKWTFGNQEQDPDEIARKMLQEFWDVSGLPPQKPLYLQAHRWKYAIPDQPAECSCFYDEAAGIAACGDWANGARVEGAFLSGMAAAGRILGSLSGPMRPVTRLEKTANRH